MNLLLLGLAATLSASSAPSDDTNAAYRELASKDPHHPRYHFAPSAFWINDPNGFVKHDGVYHLFYQLSTRPEGPDSVKHWGHATSRDLVHWQEAPIALSPGPDGGDSVGCWSGSILRHDGRFMAFYTGVMPEEAQCLAVSEDSQLLDWEKDPGNPIIAVHASGLPLISFRDPTLWRDGDHWMMGVGTGVRGKGGGVLSYRSSDLRNWEYAGPLYVDEANEYSYLFECPSFHSLGDKHLLLYSAHYHNDPISSCYFLGQYADGRFTPDTYARLDLSSDYYAAQAYPVDGRLLAFAWVKSGREQETWPQFGWSGAISFPRELSLGDDGALVIRPPRELDALRGKHHAFAAAKLTPNSTGACPGLLSDACEIQATFAPDDDGAFAAERFGLVLRQSPDGEEQTRICYEPGTKRLVMERAKSSLNEKVLKDTQQGDLVLAQGEALRLRVFLDQSIIEIYANDRVAGTLRVYPTREDSLGVDAFVEGGDVQLTQLEAWEFGSSS